MKAQTRTPLLALAIALLMMVTIQRECDPVTGVGCAVTPDTTVVCDPVTGIGC